MTINLLKNSAFILLATIILFGCDDKSPKIIENAEPPTSQSRYKILALGDSLTEGLGVKQQLAYPAQLQKQLAAIGYENIEVINAGLSGETTSGLKNRLNWVMKQEPDLTILCIGANDAMRGLPLELTTSNLSEIITSIQQSESDLILAGMQIYDNLGKEYVSGFKEIYPQMANNYQLPFIPFFLEGVAGNQQFNQADLIHPNANGYQKIVENNILPIVVDYLETNKIKRN